MKVLLRLTLKRLPRLQLQRKLKNHFADNGQILNTLVKSTFSDIIRRMLCTTKDLTLKNSKLSSKELSILRMKYLV